MENEELTGSLSADEQAYFDTKGETELKEAPEKEVEPVDPDLELDEDGNPVSEDQPKEQKTVPLAALTKERQQARELKAKLQEIEKHKAILEDRWNMVLASQQQPQRQEETPPDPNEDIFAAFAYQNKKLSTLEQQIAERANTEAQQQQAMRQEQAVWDYWNADAAEFSKQQADFGDAAKFLSEFRDSQLKALSRVDQRFASEQGRLAQINEELKAIVAQAAQQGISPAQMVYEIANGYGYKAASKAEPSEKLDKLDRAVNGAVSLSDTGGSRPGSGLDAESVAKMSEDQFAAWLAKNGDKGFKKLMGA